MTTGRFNIGDQVLGQFEIRGVVGMGRNAVVYEAFDAIQDRLVALKVLSPLIHPDPVHVERFRREAEILSTLKDAAILKVLAVLFEAELKILVIEKFDGPNLKDHLATNGPFDLERFLPLAKQIITTLIQCHQSQIAHRDLKPQNIMIAASGALKLADFGISRMTTMDEFFKTGTEQRALEYLAPECFLTSRLDTRADLYSLGCVFYEMLTGRPPFSIENPPQMLEQKLAGEYISPALLKPELPAQVVRIIEKCLTVDPNYRYQTAFEILKDLEVHAVENSLFATTQVPTCRTCQTLYLVGADFCFHCGEKASENLESGAHSVVLESTGQPDLIADCFVHNHPGLKEKVVRQKLKKVPCLVATGLSEESALILKNELAHLPGTVTVSKHRIPVQPRPLVYFLLALILLSPLFILPTLFLGPEIVALAEVLLYVSFRTRPIISRWNLRQAGHGPQAVDLSAWLALLPKVQDPHARALLGRILVHHRLAPKADEVQAIDKFFSLVENLNLRYEQLKGTDPLQLKKKIEMLNLKIKQEQGAETRADLVQTKTELMNKFKDYRRLSESHQDFYGLLLNFLSHQQGYVPSEQEFSPPLRAAS